MQHNHEVSNKMAPYYAINRRISNVELRQVADVIELMPSSRALQQFLQERFHRPITIQDAKNIRARLKILHSHQEKDVTVFRPVKAEPVETAEEEDFDTSGPEVEVLKGVTNDDGDEEVTFEHQDQQEEHHDQAQQDLASPRFKEKVVNEVKEKLSELIYSCDDNTFWERISVINKVIECWENGDNFDVHYAAESVCDNEVSVIDVNEPEPSQTDNACSSSPMENGDTQGTPVKVKTPNTPSVVGSSNSHLNFMLPVLNGSDVQFLPASVCAESLKLILSSGENEVQTNSSSITDKNLSRQRGANNSTAKRQKGIIEEVSPYQSFPKVVNALKRNLRNLESVKDGKDEKENSHVAIAKEPIIMSVSGGNEDLCDQAMEVEIEVDGNRVNVKEVKEEPVEYHEVNVTNNIQISEHSVV